MAEPPPETLWNALPADYGGKPADHVLDQYKLFVDSAQKTSDRRLSTNQYLLTINSSLLTLMGLLAGLLPDRKPLVLLCGAGVVLSSAWLVLLESFRRLNAAKFHVINRLEERLPANVFQEEWRQLARYRPMSLTEKSVPWTLLFLYAATAGILWFWPGPREEQAKRIQLSSPVRIETVSPVTVVSPPQAPAATAAPREQSLAPARPGR